jgi:MSHA pilin protein MshA
MRRSGNGGFTLIELVVVISILGILAAFAVPRFIALEGRARAATVQSLAGSVRSSATMVHGLWMASGNPGTVTVEGQTITITNGYPNRATIDNTLVDLNGFTYTQGNGIFNRVGATTPAQCRVTYTPPAAANLPPTIVVVSTGC